MSATDGCRSSDRLGVTVSRLCQHLWTGCLLLAACASDGPDPRWAPAVAPSPPLQSEERVRFVALGDAGEGNRTQRQVAEAMGRWCAARADERGAGCEFALYLGDNIYDDGVGSADDPRFESHFERPYRDLPFPFYVVLGNHDYGVRPLDSDHAAPELVYARTSKRWTQPARAYSMTAGLARFYAVDTHALLMELAWGETGQTEWLTRSLETDPEGATWNIVFGHHPYRSDGKHGDAGAYEGLPWLPLVNGAGVAEWFEAAVCGRADLYLSGHDHNLQWQPPECGVELIVSGAGAKLTPLERRAGERALFSNDQTAGFVWVELLPDRLTGVVVSAQGEVLYERVVHR